MRRSITIAASIVFSCTAARAQESAQTPQPPQDQPAQEQHVQLDRSGPVPIYRVTVVQRTTKAINYRHRSGSTPIDFRGTALMPMARGEATVNSKQGRIEIDAEMDHLTPATQC